MQGCVSWALWCSSLLRTRSALRSSSIASPVNPWYQATHWSAPSGWLTSLSQYSDMTKGCPGSGFAVSTLCTSPLHPIRSPALWVSPLSSPTPSAAFLCRLRHSATIAPLSRTTSAPRRAASASPRSLPDLLPLTAISCPSCLLLFECSHRKILAEDSKTVTKHDLKQREVELSPRSTDRR